MNIPTGFVTLQYIFSFTGMVFAVWLMTNATKSLFDKIFSNQTKYVAFAWSIFFSVVAATFLGDWSDPVGTIVIWMVNSVIVWFTAMKAYETVAESKSKSNQ